MSTSALGRLSLSPRQRILSLGLCGLNNSRTAVPTIATTATISPLSSLLLSRQKHQILSWSSTSTTTNAAATTSLSHDNMANPTQQEQQQKHETTTTTHFGYQEIPTFEKENKVRQVFESVAESYDVMNDLMSMGLHRVWKDYLVQKTCVGAMADSVRRTAAHDHNVPFHHRQDKEEDTDNGKAAAVDGCGDDVDNTIKEGHKLAILDVAGGTGDVAFRFVDEAKCYERSKSSGTDEITITVCDINKEMLRVGERRARQRYGNALIDDTQALQFVQGNAQFLPFPNDSFDLYTIAFGLRNVTNVDEALRDAYRVLKPGGRYLCLEFSHVTHTALRTLYDTYSFQVIPAIGELVANDRASYQYLVESIRKFSNQNELVERMEKVGFDVVKYTNLTGGIVAIHEGWKPL